MRTAKEVRNKLVKLQKSLKQGSFAYPEACLEVEGKIKALEWVLGIRKVLHA